MDNLSFIDILDQRPLLNCWLQDYDSSYWIRVPRIEILRMLLKEVPVSIIVTLRFPASNKSPNSLLHLTPTKKEKNVEDSVKTLSIADNFIEPFNQFRVSDMDLDHVVVIQNSVDVHAPRLFLHAESLLKTVQVDAEKGISPFNFIVRAEDKNSMLQEVKLTRQVWMKCLLRGNPRADMFLDYIAAGFENLFMLGDKLKELHSNTDLWLRLKCFHYDLRHFNEPAKSRLENYGGEYYMSNRYFSEEELNYLLMFPTASGATARESLQALFTSKSNIGEVCSSHDLAPAVENIYGIRKGFEKEKNFVAYFRDFAARKNHPFF
eukprot:CAMPEP_0170065988 /NCGR_PEP_ID=MMETSP0019_2-20121128/5852_1 /TAXON_ID=98059 /ORGANISM="Dinobryon sp., Strain UTEXLB2267" /LENGTH=320 /DNA_ID=CAMNT_0010272961 /DNA_START=71 /DNA_END=1033 /DNA_ORIENTATION=+